MIYHYEFTKAEREAIGILCTAAIMDNIGLEFKRSPIEDDILQSIMEKLLGKKIEELGIQGTKKS